MAAKTKSLLCIRRLVLPMNRLRALARPSAPPLLCTKPMVPPSRKVKSSTAALPSPVKAPTKYVSNVRRNAVRGLKEQVSTAPDHIPRSRAIITWVSQTRDQANDRDV